jgi:hypothetical protein
VIVCFDRKEEIDRLVMQALKPENENGKDKEEEDDDSDFEKVSASTFSLFLFFMMFSSFSRRIQHLHPRKERLDNDYHWTDHSQIVFYLLHTSLLLSSAW